MFPADRGGEDVDAGKDAPVTGCVVIGEFNDGVGVDGIDMIAGLKTTVDVGGADDWTSLVLYATVYEGADGTEDSSSAAGKSKHSTSFPRSSG